MAAAQYTAPRAAPVARPKASLPTTFKICRAMPSFSLPNVTAHLPGLLQELDATRNQYGGPGQVLRRVRRWPYWDRGRRKTKMRTGDCWPLPNMKLPNVPVCDAKTSQPSAMRSLTAFSAADQSRDRPQKPALLGEPDTIRYSKRVIRNGLPSPNMGLDCAPSRCEFAPGPPRLPGLEPAEGRRPAPRVSD